MKQHVIKLTNWTMNSNEQEAKELGMEIDIEDVNL